jgi:3-hydroxypropanoate dehydrogenase
VIIEKERTYMTNDSGLIGTHALDLILRQARTRKGWQDKPVPEALLRQIHADAAFGPTSVNCQPLRVVFVTSATEKARLRPMLAEGNAIKAMQSPVVAIFGHDLDFPATLPQVFPHAPDARASFEGNAPHIEETAFRNGTLQAAWFMIAARAHGLDCGPMSGFDQAAVTAAFFPDSQVKANFICSLGYGTDERLFPRSPRLTFDEVCRVV